MLCNSKSEIFQFGATLLTEYLHFHRWEMFQASYLKVKSRYLTYYTQRCFISCRIPGPNPWGLRCYIIVSPPSLDLTLGGSTWIMYWWLMYTTMACIYLYWCFITCIYTGKCSKKTLKFHGLLAYGLNFIHVRLSWCLMIWLHSCIVAWLSTSCWFMCTGTVNGW